MNVKQIHTAMGLLEAQYRDKRAELIESLCQAIVQDAQTRECDYSINCTCLQCVERTLAAEAEEEASD